MSNQKENTLPAAQVLLDCVKLMEKKAADYQNPNSTVKQVDYYPSGFQTIYEIMHAKMLRIKSLMEAQKADKYNPKNESIQDSLKDLINYASFASVYLDGNMEGQNPDFDMFNRFNGH